MAIEFLCSNCGERLRTPDDSAGKQARCPKCGTVMPIPMVAAATSNPPREPAPLTMETGPVPADVDPSNPYASPQTSEESAVMASAGEMVHTRIEFGRVMSETWAIFTKQLGPCLLLSLVMIGLIFAMYIVSIVIFGILGFSMAIAGGMNNNAGPPPAAFGVIMVIGIIVMYVGMFVFMSWMYAGVMRYGVRLARGDNAQVSDVFTGGPYMLRVLGVMLILLVPYLLFTFVFMIPGIALQEEALILLVYVGQTVGGWTLGTLFLLSLPLIVDRNFGAIESLSGSLRYLHGSKWTTLGLLIVTSIGGVIASTFTCCVGMLFVMPYFVVLISVIYLTATGQPRAT